MRGTNAPAPYADNFFDARRQLLALDFDGVIIDSIQECLLNGYNAYARFIGESLIGDFSSLPSAWLTEARRLRNFIRNGEDYVYIAHAIRQNAPITNQKDFDAFIENHRDLRQIFFDSIYNQRMEFTQKTPHLWGTLNPLYPGMIEYLISYPFKSNLYIITSKRLIFVEKILHAHGIILPKENVLDTSSASKKEIIERLLAERNCPPSSFHFIDDQIDTLLKIKPLGVNLYLAGWGYTNEAQQKTAQQYGIPVLSPDDFHRRFGGHSSR